MLKEGKRMTRTFTFGEPDGNTGGIDFRPEIHYCEYCGQKAKHRDVGERCFEYVYWCDCETAKKESELRETIERLEREIIYAKQELQDMEKTNNPVVNKMKYNNELEKLKKKYGVNP
jgi:hypothetical protein